jgi:amino acid transporter
MLVAESRPRNLKWYHAGPLLFGDWGTSRLYVLGLAFYYTGHASPLYLTAMSVLMIGVAWCYSIICKTFQDGGGVYAVARLLSPTLAVIGATLLLCDFTVTAALSIIDGLHYFGIQHDNRQLTVGLALFVIFGLGLINWVGARSAGRFALVVAVAALGASALIALMCLPLIGPGLKSITVPRGEEASLGSTWQSFVHIVLALSGVEAVANMTGLMKPPVAKTAKKTIWPVLTEVVVLNMLFGVALCGLPALAHITQPDGVNGEVIGAAVPEYRDTALRVLATDSATRLFGGAAAHWIAMGTGILFALLLLSAANTAVMAMVSVLYSMAQDRELPRPLARLNYSGVPWIGLLLACGVPAALVLIMSDVAQLADLYAVGVCGAITISLLGCVVNAHLPIKTWERWGMGIVGVTVMLIEATIIWTKPHATLFAGIVLGAVLGTRQLLLWTKPRLPVPLPAPMLGWLEEIRAASAILDPTRPRIMLAARGRYQSEFAVDLTRRRNGVLFAIFVRTVRVLDLQPGKVPQIEEDPEAQESLGTTATLARQAGVPFFPIYVVSSDVVGEILDYTVTYGCDVLIMGKSRRSLFARTFEGDIVTRLAEQLPDNVALVTRSANAPHVPLPRPAEAEEEEGHPT